MIDWGPDTHKLWSEGHDSPGDVPKLLRQWLLAQDNERCFEIFKCITARVAVPDARRGSDVQIKLNVVHDEKTGKVGGTQHICKAQTCFQTLLLPRYETVEQLERGMDWLLRQSKSGGFTDR